MGKKGVIMDNGKQAQSAMALYWKAGREKAKLPKEKVAKPVDEQKQLDQRVQSGFQKWKLHKEKIITKAYKQKQKPGKDESERISSELERQEKALQEQLIEKQLNKNKPISIPGFSSRNELQKRLTTEQVSDTIDQSNNVLILPQSMADLTQQDIIRILREKKSKRGGVQAKKIHEEARQTVELDNSFVREEKQEVQVEKQHRELPADFNALLGDERIDELEELKKKEETQKRKAKQIADKKQFFKSEILNQIEKGDLSGIIKKPPPTQKTHQDQIQKNQISSDETKLPKPTTTDNVLKFIPRVLKR